MPNIVEKEELGGAHTPLCAHLNHTHQRKNGKEKRGEEKEEKNAEVNVKKDF